MRDFLFSSLCVSAYVRVVLVRRFFSASPVPSAVPGSFVVKFFIASGPVPSVLYIINKTDDEGWEKDRVPTSPPARAGSCKDDQGHRGTGARGAHRGTEGGWAGFTHTTGPQGFPSRIGQARRAAPGAGAGCALLVLLLPTRNSDRLAARWTPYSTGDLSRLATFLRLAASHWQSLSHSLSITGTLTEAAKAKKRKKENRQPKGGMGGRHAATTQGF